MARPINPPPSQRLHWMALVVVSVLPAAAGPGALAQSGWNRPSTPPPPPGQLAPGLAPLRGEASAEGRSLEINGRRQQARWQWQDQANAQPAQLWLPLEVLQGQLGFASRSRPDGGLDLEWFGLGQRVPAEGLRSLDDEVALDVGPLLRAAGVRVEPGPGTLRLQVPQPALLRVRASAPGAGRRVVLDLEGVALVRQDPGQLLVGLRSTDSQRADLQALGLTVVQSAEGLLIRQGRGPGRVLTLGSPARLVLDLSAAGEAAAATPPPLDPRLQALLDRSVAIERQMRSIGQRQLLISSVRLDPRSSPLELRLLTRGDGMEGLSSLPALAQREQALVAINGGFFNRVRRMPLGALKDEGRWLSGPILNRGAVAWQPGSLPRFGRLSLEEWLVDGNGQRWPVTSVNSGYVQRGLARYTADWGRGYRALSGNESGLLVSRGVVQQQLDSGRLEQGVALGPEDMLLVGRAGVIPPWSVGSRLNLSSRANDPVGDQPFVMGGGPLLLLGGRVVLNGTAEGFSPAFQSQGAPRTVIGTDGRQLWLVTLQGVENSGPTLSETAAVLRQMGLQDALNLDGGSSTGLLVGTSLTVKGRGVTASIHNGLGLVPRNARAAEGSEARLSRGDRGWAPSAALAD